MLKFKIIEVAEEFARDEGIDTGIDLSAKIINDLKELDSINL
jgi:hypothetical protein